MKNSILENELFYCEHITDSQQIQNEIKLFTVKENTGYGLVRYLQNHALSDERNGEMRTYLVRDKRSNDIVGYFSLKAGMVSINERRRFFHKEFDCVSGIELANFAVNNSYKESHKEYEGLGTVIFYYFVMPIVKNVSEQIGVSMLFIFSLPYKKLMAFYKTLHFERLSVFDEHYVHKRIKPRYDRDCVFMYQPISEE